MLGITDLPTYLLGVIFIILLPGPNSLFVLAVAAARGVRSGSAAACGVFVGDAVLMTLTALGAASVLHTFPVLFFVLKYAGAIYLTWLGLNMLRGALARWRAAASNVATPPAVDATAPFRRALVISLLNPKAILFLLSFFIQFVDRSYAYPALTFLALGAILQVCSVLYLTTLIFAGVRLAESFRSRRRLAAGLTGSVGALFVGFGGKLAASSL
ncbi:MAG TPA: leucine efflux protein LeuE [Candidatus Competibacteraceae bacterium]|nr:leucine efflux protein LeuE [Candidatus Competibacteraceae bacterium]